jgi:lipopolysaccharide export system permease protein
MRILHRYVLTSFLVPLAYCLVTFISLYVVVELLGSFSALAAAKPSFGVIVGYFAGVVAPFLEWLLAASLLLASLYTMWQLCRHSEVTAMRASGLGFGTIISPLVGVAVLLSVVSALNLEFYAPDAAENTKRLDKNQFRQGAGDIRENIHYYNTLERRNWRINRMDVFSPRVLEGVRITCERPNGTREMEVACKRAEYRDGMWWLLYPQHTWFDELDMQMESRMPQLDNLSLRLMPSLNEIPSDFVNETREWSRLSIRARLRYMRVHPDLSAEERASKWYDIHSRFASPWACTIITLFAIPMGVATGRQGVFKGILMAIALFFAFFVAVNGCMILAKRGLIPPLIGAWLPNVSFLAAGLCLLWRQR